MLNFVCTIEELCLKRKCETCTYMCNFYMKLNSRDIGFKIVCQVCFSLNFDNFTFVFLLIVDELRDLTHMPENSTIYIHW